MNIIEFQYQNYWKRAFFLLPLIMILPYIEYELLEDVITGIFGYLVICTIVTFLLAFTFYKHTNRWFTKGGTMKITDLEVYIECGKRKAQLSEIKKVELEEKKLYGTRFGLLIITFVKAGKEEMYSIISEDLGTKKFEECSLWKCYEMLSSEKLKVKSNEVIL